MRNPHPREWNGDPRDFLDPAYASVVSDEAVQQWRENHWCLCGCQLKTKIRTGSYKNVPSRTHHFFYKYHQWRLGDVRSGRTNGPVHRANISKGIRAANMDTKMLGYVIDEYLESNPGMNIKLLAAKIGMGRVHLCEIRNYTVKSIRKSTFVKILEGCDEPVRKDLRNAA